MATEEQTTYSFYAILAGGGGSDKWGQKLTISNRIVSKLGFWLYKRGTPTGDITFEIRKVSDDSVIVSKVWGAGSTLPATVEYLEATFDTATYVNEEVRIVCAVDEEDEANGARMGYERADEKADEHTTYIIDHPAGSWEDVAGVGWDTAYKYTYTTPTTPPTVTIQAVTAISGTTATGNGNVAALGDAPVTQHGHCWNTTGTPDTDDSKTENGAKAATGAFTSSMTSLTAGTKYYVRAYAANPVGTGYSTEVAFWADEGTVFPSDTVARVSSIRHIFRPGFFRMQVGLGDLGLDIDIAEATVRKALDTATEAEPSLPTEWPPAPGEEPGPIACPYCGLVVPYLELAEHIRTVHPQPGAQPTPTPPSSPTAPALKEEIKHFKEIAEPLTPITDPKPFKCPYCGATFATATEQGAHIRIVHGGL